MCSEGMISYDHYDKSKLVKQTMCLKGINVPMVIKELHNAVDELNSYIDSTLDINMMNNKIENTLYNACYLHKKKRNTTHLKNFAESKNHLDSSHCHAIADANYNMVKKLLNQNVDETRYLQYLEQWQLYKDLASHKEEKEYNTNINHKWKSCAKSNGRKLWELIDWNEKSSDNNQESNDPDVINLYFSNIFQSEKTAKNPTIQDVIQKINQYEIYIPLLDDDITIHEVNVAIEEIGTGVGIDGINPDISKILPYRFKLTLVKLLCRIHGQRYPDKWKNQVLFSITKKGHSREDPKLRGIAISSLIPKMYDIILNNRFNLWYHPNPQQAGFRPKQGCLLQIFTIYLMIELANHNNKTIFIGFMDYEKAFDFTNRADIVAELMEKDAGAKFTRSIANMYDETFYTPKINNKKFGKSITSKHGVTQGRKTSSNFFSFTMSEMHKAISTSNSYLKDIFLLQLADDAALLAENIDSLSKLFKQVLRHSSKKYMIANITKTFYMDMKCDPCTSPLDIDNGDVIKSAKDGKYIYLGMLFIHTNNMLDMIKANLKHRAFNIRKFLDWLEVNENTPIVIKLKVLDTCMLPSYLYGAETWWKVDEVADLILGEERMLLKRILGIKKGTPTDLVYIELDRSDIISKIKDLQYNFFKKLLTLKSDDAIVVKALDMCKQLDIYKYYKNLYTFNQKQNKEDRMTRTAGSTSTMFTRYNELFDMKINSVIYTSYLSETYRTILTRWRLSNFDLRIETGRYDDTPRELRLCNLCLRDEIEDENHIIFICNYYNVIRLKYHSFLQRNSSVKNVLNPMSPEDCNTAGKFLTEIEELRS